MNAKNAETFYISSEDSGQRLDVYLCSLINNVSRSFLQKLIKNQKVLVNNNPVKSSFIVRTDDCVTIELPERDQLKIEPQNLDLKVIYEDDACAVVFKPKNMLTHPTSNEKDGTLVNALLYHFENLCRCNGCFRPGIVHRLDRNTSGLLLIAKTDKAYENLKLQMQNRTITKKYYAIVSGIPDPDCGTISANIGRHPSKPQKMAVVDDGKPSVTHYRVIERFAGFSLLDINLETGRTHQIRVHLSSIKHPVVCDSLYGGAKLPVKTQEQVLQAYSLTFVSPETNEKRTVEIGFDNDIIKVINYLRDRK